MGNTQVTVDGPRVLVNGEPVRLFGCRVGSAALTAAWTEELIGQLDLWREHGINCLHLWLQGTAGGYTRLFTEDGSGMLPHNDILVRVNYGDEGEHPRYATASRQEIVARTRAIVAAADRRAMVVLIGIFYRHALLATDTTATLERCVRTGVAPFADCGNVIVNVFNEPIIERPREGVADLARYLRAAREAAPGLVVGAGCRRAADNPPVAELADNQIILHDAGDDGPGSVAVHEELRRFGKPIMNVESFAGRGNGHVDDDSRQAAAPEGYYLDFPGWRRVYGAWREQDYRTGLGTPTIGRRAYLQLIDAVGNDATRQTHLLIHVGSWFQGASRAGRLSQLGTAGTAGHWNNTFAPGYGDADGTLRQPGIRWILNRIARYAES